MLMLTRRVAVLCLTVCAIGGAFEFWSLSRLVRTEDLNRDGRPDIWRRYDSHGHLAQVEIDSNFDGRPDIAEFYERGVLVRRESDRNFNGQADLVEEFDAETHGQIRSVVDVDYDGIADLLILFRDGRPVFSQRAVSGKRPSVQTPYSVDHGDRSRLARLLDPFESETAVRATRNLPNAGGCVVLSTSAGLPCDRLTSLGRLQGSARMVARDVQPVALTLALCRSPRAPPAC